MDFMMDLPDDLPRDPQQLRVLATRDKSEDAQYALGELYHEKGDLVEAYAWFAVAATFGHKQAAEQRDNIEKLLKEDEIPEAKHRARDLIKSIGDNQC